ncbi:predicted protein [Histoplasma mississippiense (nom. inval.)]|uniref:predicted protein n=1 Tax=Ajellomyces capsulatus (strain NAm1 / WU24) TaxID=2059318 RepID=UPI000157D1C9|nr:predicted protein [Histoplasma mississippiense (nom. inval.)]EDN10933.1 predicted protein [Histoplasma mississippiense (nom. inval.)]
MAPVVCQKADSIPEEFITATVLVRQLWRIEMFGEGFPFNQLSPSPTKWRVYPSATIKVFLAALLATNTSWMQHTILAIVEWKFSSAYAPWAVMPGVS